MLKKILAFALACTVSLSASAGYVQYDLEDLRFDDGKSAHGWFIQNTDNGAIAFYQIYGGFNLYMPGSDLWTDSDVTRAWISVPGGPTSFVTWSNNYSDYHSTLSLRFGAGGAPGTWTIAGAETSHHLYNANAADQYHAIVSGRAALGQIDARLLAALEAGIGWTEVVPAPQEVPEPAGLALLAVGALAGLRRRLTPAAA